MLPLLDKQVIVLKRAWYIVAAEQMSFSGPSFMLTI